MFRRISDFIKGYVCIEVSGQFSEKFLNLVIKKGITVSNINRVGINKIYLKIYIKDFIKIKNAAKISSCKIKISKREGIHFAAWKYKKRIILLLGIAISSLLVYTMSNMIFTVEIKGNKNIKTEYINELLKDNGLKPYVFNNIKGSEIAKKIMSQNTNIAWVGIEISGSKAVVEVVEKPDVPVVYDPNMEYNIVADTDGIISHFYLKRGFAVVKQGDTVKKGQLLVSGVTDSQTQQIRYLNPEADVKIITWLTEKSQVPLENNIDNLTKNQITNFHIEINGKRYGITHKIPYVYYKIKTEEISILPWVKLIKTHNIENVPEKIIYDEKELFEIERKKLYNKIADKLTAQYEILNSEAYYTLEGNQLITTVVCTAEGPFVQKKEINQ